MLIITTVVSLLLLLTASVAVRFRSVAWFRIFNGLGVGLSVCFAAVGLLLPLPLLFASLFLAVAGWHSSRRQRWVFPLLACTAVFTTFGVTGWVGWSYHQELNKLRS